MSHTGLPWGPCTGIQGASLTTAAGLGAGPEPWGLSPVSALAAESPEQGPVCLSRCFLPLGPKEEAPSPPVSLGCELEIQHQGSGRLARPWVDPHLGPSPSPLAEAGAEKEAWGSPAHCGDQGSVSTMAWTPLLLVFVSLCTGRHRPRAPGLSPSLISPWDSDSGNLSRSARAMTRSCRTRRNPYIRPMTRSCGSVLMSKASGLDDSGPARASTPNQSLSVFLFYVFLPALLRVAGGCPLTKRVNLGSS